MSLDNRDYMHQKEPGGQLGPSSWSMTTRLLAINAVVYLFQHTVLYGTATLHGLSLTGAGLRSGLVFELVSYQFLHANLWHLGGNMLFLFFLGRMAEQLLSGRHVLWIYLLGGALGGIAQVLFDLAVGLDSPVIGASGSVIALLFAVATLIPYRTIYFLLFFVIPIKMSMRQAALFLFAINLVILLVQLGNGGPSGQNNIAVFGHFGGMFLGWAYIHFILPRVQRRDHDRKQSNSMRRKFGIRVIKDAEVSKRSPEEADSPSSVKSTFVSKDVDAILDKISAEGMQSLTAGERKLLEKSSRKLGRKLDDH